VHHLLPADVPNSTRVGIMAIGDDPVGRHTGHRPRRAEEGLGRRQVPRVAAARVDSMAVPVDGQVQRAPAPLDSDVYR
jgi:hypothetical protein